MCGLCVCVPVRGFLRKAVSCDKPTSSFFPHASCKTSTCHTTPPRTEPLTWFLPRSSLCAPSADGPAGVLAFRKSHRQGKHAVGATSGLRSASVIVPIGPDPGPDSLDWGHRTCSRRSGSRLCGSELISVAARAPHPTLGHETASSRRGSRPMSAQRLGKHKTNCALLIFLASCLSVFLSSFFFFSRPAAATTTASIQRQRAQVGPRRRLPDKRDAALMIHFGHFRGVDLARQSRSLS